MHGSWRWLAWRHTIDRSVEMSTPSRQLLTFTFAPGYRLEGQLVGALERIETGGAMRILDAVFVSREDESGNLVAIAMSSDSASAMVARLLTFRLDPSARGDTTAKALAGPSGPLVRSLEGRLQPGEAIAALLVEHAWQQLLDDAVSRVGGSALDNKLVADDRISEAHLDGGDALDAGDALDGDDALDRGEAS
jgi:hypothetical protein